MSGVVLPKEKMLKLIWMVRPDLRRGIGEGDHLSHAFQMWWQLESGASFPAWRSGDPLGQDDLLRPLPAWPSNGSFGMSKVLLHLMEQRADLRAAFDVATEEGLWASVAWLFAHGLREYGLLERVDGTVIAALDAAPAFLALDDPRWAGQPRISWLMFFVWRSIEQLRQNFDLGTVEGQMLYVHWFLFDGVPSLSLQPLVAQRWRDWLTEATSHAGSVKTVARAAVLLWYRRPGMQEAGDIRTQAGWHALSAWAGQAWQHDDAISWVAARRDSERARARPFGVNLIGFAYGELGIGEDVRMAVAACEAASIPFSVINIHPGDSLRQNDRLLAPYLADGAGAQQAPYAINIFCLTGSDTARVYLEQGMALFQDRYNIGWWPWELPVWPSEWKDAFDVVDEVWAATTFTQVMYEQAVVGMQRPPQVTRMPLPASVARAAALGRRDFGLAEGTCVFLYVFDFNSYLSRKNPFAAIDAFQRAFGAHDQSVRLVLKTMNSKPGNPVWMRFVEACLDDERIMLFDQTLDRGDILALVGACDAYVSLHRSEGFGRTMAEAMLFGKPVVGTGFSGNVDFLRDGTGFPVRWKKVAVKEGEYPYVVPADSAWWAEPDLDHAAEQLLAAKKACADRAFAARVQSYAHETFSERRIGLRILERLTQLVRQAGGH
ncbi:glycosyltransferase [Massilia genomosp. 1]|uniref:Glycosyltransferase n=1 Tax=Massilia genomosp. 1 TaxID=2609280 RepID=A0ABX0MS68_9BURK|nr:glycosyltransferase [Massilia genomosp. 1]